MPTQILHATGLSGLFRVVAIGDLALGAPFDPRIKLLLRRIEGFEGAPTGHPRANYGLEMASLPVPIGEMLSLSIGTTINSDQVIESPDVAEFDVATDFRRGLDGCFRRHELQERGLLPALQGGPAVEDVRPEESWWYLAPSVDPRFEFVIFPAPLLYTTYYAPTSRMANRILAGDASDLAESFVDAEKTRPINTDGHAEIHLRRGVLRAEAIAIARAWYDPAFHERMRSIHANVATSTISGVAADLCVAPPPTTSTVRLCVKALTLRPRGHARPSLIALSILDSDEALPFRTLDVHLDQTEPSHGGANEGQGSTTRPGRRPASDFLSLFCKLDGNDTRPGASPPKVVVIKSPTVCFSALARLSVTRRERKQPSKRRKPLESNTSTNTTRRSGGHRGNQDNQETTLSQIDSNRDRTTDGAADEESKSPMEAFDGLLAAVRELGNEHDVAYSSRIVTPEAFGYREFVLNQLQKPEAARSPNWYFLAGTQLPRPLLLLEIRRNQRHALLLEIVRNPGEQFSSLLVIKPNAGAFSDVELTSLLSLVQDAQQIPKHIEVSTVVGGTRESVATIRRFRHGSEAKALAARLADCLQ